MSSEHRAAASQARARRGFTLIELLVVVSIVALLVALVATGLSGARAAARRTKCASNLHQLATAWHTYVMDHGDYFLKGTNRNVNYGGQQGRGSTQFGNDPNDPNDLGVKKPLNPYVATGLDPVAGRLTQSPVGVERLGEPLPDVFACPADTGAALAPPSALEYYGSSYETNSLLIGEVPIFVARSWPYSSSYAVMKGRGLVNELKLSQISTSAESLILMGDATWSTMLLPSIYTDTANWHDASCSFTLAYMDGHAALTRMRKGIVSSGEPRYDVVPFAEFAKDAAAQQREVEGYCPR